MVSLRNFLITITLLISYSAQAKFMVEPMVGKYIGTMSVSGTETDFTADVTQVSLGYLGNYFMAGVLIENGSFHLEDNLTNIGHKYFKGGGVGTFIGFHFFDRIKFWTGYLNSTLEPISRDSFRYFGQQGIFGLGYRVQGGLMVNAQYFTNQYTQSENDDTGETNGLNPVIKSSGYLYSLSYILAF